MLSAPLVSAASVVTVDNFYVVTVEEPTCFAAMDAVGKQLNVQWAGSYVFAPQGCLRSGVFVTDLDASDTITFARQTIGGSAYTGASYTITALADAAPSFLRRVSSYAQGEAAVLCAALFAFFFGFRTGMA
jgi:hypothetical protein